MHQKSQRIFEGKIYQALLKRNTKNILKINNLNLNKAWLSDLIPDYIEDRKITKIKKIKIFLKCINKIFFLKTSIHKIHYGKNKIWLLISPTVRLKDQKFFNKEIKAKCEPSIVTWKNKFQIKNVREIILQFYYYFQILKILNSIIKGKNINIYQVIYNALVNIDLTDAFNFEKPSIIFSLKDYQRHECAITLVANNSKIKTFTSQHACHPLFKEKNERAGNIIFSNCSSKNILLWGDFCKSSYKFYKNNSDKKFYQFKSSLLPRFKHLKHNKKNLLICLGSKRHLHENLKIISLVNELLRKKKFNYKLLFKSHPSYNKDEVLNILKKKLVTQNFTIQNTKTESYYKFNDKTVAITGLSGAYYDCLLLGIKTIFVDYNYKIFKKLPRVYTGVKSTNDLINQIKFLEKLNKKAFIKKSSFITESVLNRKVKDLSHFVYSDKICDIVELSDYKLK